MKILSLFSGRRFSVFGLLLCFLFLSHFLGTAAAASRHPVRGSLGMVVSAEAHATEVGVTILKSGGNAVDAAVAVGFALAVTFPEAGNLGGGGFLLFRSTDGSETVSIDFREMAPQSAHRTMYQNEKEEVIPEASTVGWRAAAVPGSVAGLLTALQRYGTKKPAEVLAPALQLAEKGFRVAYSLESSLYASRKLLQRFPESRRIFLKDGNYYREGDWFRQPELAETLRKIIAGGAEAFYEGPIAEQIADDMKANTGTITREDLRLYRPKLRTPVHGTYKGMEIYSMGPPSSGGIALLEILNILEPFPLAKYGHNSSQSLHLISEAMRRAFADRAEFLGDSDFVKVPVEELTDKAYADDRRKTIDPYLAGKSTAIGHGTPTHPEPMETTHYSVVDKDGNAVAVTTTLNGSYGCGITVRGAGFLLNNEMDDFSSKPGVPNMFRLIQGEANSIAAGKRPLSAMTPVIVVRDKKNYLVMGSPGGPTIINTVTQVLLNVLEYGMNIQEAIDAPRIHHQWMPDTIRMERYGISNDVIQALQARGHHVEFVQNLGDAQGIVIDPESGIRLGASDPRHSGLASGYGTGEIGEQK